MSGDIMAGVDLSAVTTALTNAVSVSDVVSVIATGIGVAVPFVLTWFAIRYIYRKFTSALKGGRG